MTHWRHVLLVCRDSYTTVSSAGVIIPCKRRKDCCLTRNEHFSPAISCKSAPEDRKHFILQCSSTERIRGKYLPKIRNFINESDKNLDLENIDTLLQLIINPSAFYHEKRHLPILD